jgi:hypothetical protein
LKQKKPLVGLRKFLKDAWDISLERVRINKALRRMNKQEWSIEFLTAMLYRAARHYGQQLEMTIVGPGGMAITVRTTDNKPPTNYSDDSILNHLDDELKVRQFIEMMESKRNDK